MDKHKDTFKGFCHTGEAWYRETASIGRDSVDEVMIGFYAHTGGTSGEFCIRWRTISGHAVPRLEAYDDAWDALANMPELLALFASVDNQNIKPVELCGKLVELGYQDRTPRDNPYEEKAAT
jgi:hypothetical protein